MKYKVLPITSALLVLLSSPLALSQEYCFEEALKQSVGLGLELPQQEEDGRVRTLNKKGSMFEVEDPISTDFLANLKGKRVLEIGAAYGNILLKALGSKFHSYTVNDLDPRHLFIAASRVKKQIEKLPAESSITENISFVDCDFGTSCEFPSNSFDSILIARVLHFFRPEKLAAVISELNRILKPGGKVYAISTTPYVSRYSKFIPIYEERQSRGELFPGYVENLSQYLDHTLISEEELKKVHNEAFMFLDPAVLTREFNKAEFEIEVAKTVPLEYESMIWRLDGRENVVIVARKR